MTLVRDEFESVLEISGWFPVAPFNSIGLILFYGNKTNYFPEFKRIHKSSGELEITVELDMKELRAAQRAEGRFKSLVRTAIAGALLGVADKYKLPKDAIEQYVFENTVA